MLENLIGNIRRWNHQRLQNARLKRVLEKDLDAKRGLPDPGANAARILILDALWGIGDALYANGLAARLEEVGKSVTVATLTRSFPVYEGNSALNGVFKIDTPEGLDALAQRQFDLVLDISYVGLDRWPLRFEVMRRISAYTVSCSKDAARAKAVDRVIDISKATHVSERMALIYRDLTGETAVGGFIRPQFGSGGDRRLPTVYVNCTAGEADRMMSKQQTEAMAAWFATNKRYIGLFYVDPAAELPDSPYVRRVPAGSLADAAELIRSSVAVVTPDTAVTHFANAYGIPAVVLFCGGEPDYFGLAPMSAVWAPLTHGSRILEGSGPDSERDKKGHFPVSTINPELIVDALIRVLQPDCRSNSTSN